MLPINNAANSLGLGSKKYSECFTPNASHSTILIVFYLLFSFVNVKKNKNKLKEKTIYLKSKVSKQEKKYKNFGKL